MLLVEGGRKSSDSSLKTFADKSRMGKMFNKIKGIIEAQSKKEGHIS